MSTINELFPENQPRVWVKNGAVPRFSKYCNSFSGLMCLVDTFRIKVIELSVDVSPYDEPKLSNMNIKRMNLNQKRERKGLGAQKVGLSTGNAKPSASESRLCNSSKKHS